MVMIKRYKSKWWSIRLPPNWEAEKEEFCVTFTAENGVGILQIRTFRHNSKDLTYQNFLGFTEDKLVDGVELRNSTCGEFTGIGISYLVDGHYWRKWWLWRDSIFLYVTYNCSAEECVIEMDTVDRMMSSLKKMLF